MLRNLVDIFALFMLGGGAERAFLKHFVEYSTGGIARLIISSICQNPATRA